MNAWQEVRCPACHKLLFAAAGINPHAVIRVICRCKRTVDVREGWTVTVAAESSQVTPYLR
jgi:hypothetical protein